jgi:hypothetical protein
MKRHFLEQFVPLRASPRPGQSRFASQMSRISFVIVLCLGESVLAAAQSPPSAPPSPDAQKCAALTALNLEAAPGGPAIITSARLVEVPASGLQPPFFHPSGYASGVGAQVPGKIKQYCDVSGYVAPQNKFELKLPLPGDWNQKFFFIACGGFCGTVLADACNLGLARGYASATGNGGHDSVLGFDGVWAANAPELQEDFGSKGGASEKCLGTEVPVDCKSVRVRLMVLPGLRPNRSASLGRGLGCIRGPSGRSKWKSRAKG